MKQIPYPLDAYENGELEHDQVLELFRYLIDSGLVNTLQGHYGRTAKRLILAGELEA
jgi:hypothetical protein